MHPPSSRAPLAALLLVFTAAPLPAGTSAETPPAAPPLPERLADTGLYVPGSLSRIHPDNQPFTPQYPLWTDGAGKRRWLYLPPGTHIDASDPDAWDFPPGTRLWKEFSHGRPIETRLIERLPDGAWRFATYVWNEDGSEAVLAPERGIAALPAPEAPGGRYRIPSRDDCRACHEGGKVPVLGFSALQLSPDRDPLAPNAEPLRPGDADLPGLVARGQLVNLPPQLLAEPPRIRAGSPSERATLGYLHANCGHCHNRASADDPAVPVDLSLSRQVGADRDDAQALKALIETRLRYRGHGSSADLPLIAPGDAEASVLLQRMRTRNPMARMPPLGTRIPDPEALELIGRWIGHDLHPSPGATR
ncbi:hypothetical protein [Rehaibacterium terrae]|jgi:hypothetical protein|uniref:Cytochrome c domain-containing protein n=1 Tax=Rehaibacterium terrae TaxID=1341696 RepID=A0A7W7Y055_9GAMM|nr:hypothetical protein [Rehaibacterium terrae]MBB5015666.1 hypothetical protein [Rehaibacterium terrae]